MSAWWTAPHIPPGLKPDQELLALPRYGQGLTGARAVFSTLCQFLGLVIVSPFFTVLMAPSLGGRCLFGRDPRAPRWSLVKSLISKALFDTQMTEPMSFLERVRTAMLVLHTALKSHSINSCCWYVDELLGCCGGWRSAEVADPVFLVANTRTGSTELGSKLHKVGEHLISPTFAQQAFPYLWLWRLVRRFCFVDTDRIRELFESMMNRNYPFFHRRHKTDLFGPDTFEIAFNMSSFTMGPAGCMVSPNTPIYGLSLEYLEEDLHQFCNYLEAVLKKTIHFSGRPASGRPFVKGHFIYAAPMLQRKYPSALFAVTARDMGAVFRSTLNFGHCLPIWANLGRPGVEWTWIRQLEVTRQLDYCRREVDFFCRDPPVGPPPKRLVLQFEEYVQDLVQTMQKVFDAAGISVQREELEAAAASKVTTLKGKNEEYAFDVSLEELGIPREWVEVAFRDWEQHMRTAKAPVSASG